MTTSLLRKFRDLPEVQTLAARAGRAGTVTHAGGLRGSSAALLAATLAAEQRFPVILLIVKDQAQMHDLEDDLSFLRDWTGGHFTLHRFPHHETRDRHGRRDVRHGNPDVRDGRHNQQENEKGHPGEENIGPHGQ